MCGDKWPYLKGDTFSKPSFWVSMLDFRGVLFCYINLTSSKSSSGSANVEVGHNSPT